MSEPSAVHRGGMRWIAEELKRHGTGGDTEVVHMNKREMALLERVLDRKAKKNPHTGLPSFDDSGNAGNAGDTASSGGGNPGDNSGGGGGGPSGQGSGGGSSGNVGGLGPGETATSIGSPSGLGPGDTSTSATGNPGETSASANEASTPGLTGNGFLDGLINGFLSHPIQSLIDFGFGLVPGFGTANSISSLAGGPTVGKGVTMAGRAIGDAFSGSGGFSGTGGEGPSPTGGAGGSEGAGLGSGAPGPGAVRNPLTGGTTNSPVSGAGGVGNTGIGTGGSNSGGWDPRVVQILSQVSGKPGVNLGLS